MVFSVTLLCLDSSAGCVWAPVPRLHCCLNWAVLRPPLCLLPCHSQEVEQKKKQIKKKTKHIHRWMCITQPDLCVVIAALCGLKKEADAVRERKRVLIFLVAWPGRRTEAGEWKTTTARHLSVSACMCVCVTGHRRLFTLKTRCSTVTNNAWEGQGGGGRTRTKEKNFVKSRVAQVQH